jgi:acyl dehydratase
MQQPAHIEDLRRYVGEDLGVSAWHDVTQGSIDAFAAVTGDHQYIHTDPQRAAATPFGGTIAHGYYTLALAPALLTQVLSLEGFAMAVNYGLDKLRFPGPLPVGDRVRLHVRLDRVDEHPGGGTLALTMTFERAGGAKPVCIANVLYRVFEENDPS